MTNEQKHEELLQTLATVNIQYLRTGTLTQKLSEHIKTVLKTCKIGDDSEVINGVRHFKFSYQVPKADVIAELDVEIECDCRAFINAEGECCMFIENSKFNGDSWSDLWNAYATYIKLHEAAKQHYINYYSNAKESLMSEQEVNDIFNYNKEN